MNKSISSEKKDSFIIHSHNILQENAFKVNLDEDLVKYMNFYAKSVIEIMAEDERVFNLAD
ncbi:hypothetical protein, partial [Bacteriovorax sp. DB6_IX]|uniref:hypothetical protein n=1 Tax=Bacteriovorax sp. DB6_IX TaxID=1353530 RepID=UPI00038A3434